MAANLVQLKEAALRVAARPEGRILLDYFKQLYEQDKNALIQSEIPEQTRRLQGQARRMNEILSFFNVE